MGFFAHLDERRIIGKIQKTFFSGEVIFGGQNPKNAKKNAKIFIVPNRLLGHTDHLYTYKGYVGHVGLTEKRKNLSKLAVLPVKKLMEQNWTKFFFI